MRDRIAIVCLAVSAIIAWATFSAAIPLSPRSPSVAEAATRGVSSIFPASVSIGESTLKFDADAMKFIVSFLTAISLLFSLISRYLISPMIDRKLAEQDKRLDKKLDANFKAVWDRINKLADHQAKTP